MKRILGVWALVAVLMIANGVFREMVLTRVAARSTADVLSAAIAIAIVLGVTRLFPFRVGATSAELLRVSAVWLILTVGFEFGFGHLVDRKSWSTLIENYAIWRGRLWPLVLAAFVASPFIWRRKSGLAKRVSR